MSDPDQHPKGAASAAIRPSLARASRLLPLLPTAAAALLALAALPLPGHQAVPLILDDGYIHARLGEVLASGGGLGINPGEGGGGSSSLLWTLLLALLVRAGAMPASAALWAGIGSLLLAVGAAGRLAALLLRPLPALGAALGVALAGQLVALGHTGMETLLAAGLFLLALVSARESVRPWPGALLAGLTVATRPDFLLPLLALALVLGLERGEEHGQGRRRALLIAGSACAAAALAFALLTLLAGEAPSTLEARRWLHGLAGTGWEGWLRVQGTFWRDLGVRLVWFVGPAGTAGWLWTAAGALAAGVGAWRLARRPLGAALLGGALLQLLFAGAVIGSEGHLGRYVVLAWISLPLAAAAGLAWLGRSLGPPLGRPLALLAGLGLLAGLVPGSLRWPQWVDQSREHLATVHLAVARDIPQAVEPGRRVAAFDIGLLALRCRRPVEDISGLTGGTALRALKRRSVGIYLDQREVSFVALPERNREHARHVLPPRIGLDPRLLVPLARHGLPGPPGAYLHATKLALPAMGLYFLPPRPAGPEAGQATVAPSGRPEGGPAP